MTCNIYGVSIKNVQGKGTHLMNNASPVLYAVCIILMMKIINNFQKVTFIQF